MLEAIDIQKFKQLRSVSERLDKVNVLVGTNNSGKSSFLQAIHSAVALAQSRLRLLDQPRMNTEQAGFTIGAQDVLYLPLVNTSWLAPNGGLTQTSGPKISFTISGQPPAQGSVDIRRGKNRNLSVKLNGRLVISQLERLEAPFSVYVPGLAGITKNEAFIGLGNLLRAVARGDANLVLRNVLNALKANNTEWRAFLTALRQVFPEKTVAVHFDQQADEFINVIVRQGESEIPLDCVGTSFLQTVQILSYIYLFNPAVTLLDEPDSHLHPNNQRALAELLWNMANEGKTQFILSTHSRHILDVLRDKEGVNILWCKGGATTRASANIDILTDLGALDSAEGLLAEGIEFIVLTEDKRKKMFKTILSAHGIQESRYQIWDYKGCSRQDVAQALANFIHEISPTTRIIVHRDSDYLLEDDLARLRQSYQDVGLTAFFTTGVDIEGLFCTLDHLRTVNPSHAAVIDTIHPQALLACAVEFKEKAKRGAEEVDHLRHKVGVATRGREAIDEWLETLDFTTQRWIHGKIFLSKLRGLFQQQTGTNLMVERASAHLQSPTLANLLPQISNRSNALPPNTTQVSVATPVVTVPTVA